jgi:hypothetical protein
VRFTRVAAYPLRSRSCSSRESANDMGLVSSLISKMRSSLSMRGMHRRWWKLAMTDVTPNLESAKWRRAEERDSSLLCRAWGDTPCTQASCFFFNTFSVYGGRPAPLLRR